MVIRHGRGGHQAGTDQDGRGKSAQEAQTLGAQMCHGNSLKVLKGEHGNQSALLIRNTPPTEARIAAISDFADILFCPCSPAVT
jgi:hypothetical protein